MKETTKRVAPYRKFTFGRQEFKDLLGIDCPGDVLDVSVDFYKREVEVTMNTKAEA